MHRLINNMMYSRQSHQQPHLLSKAASAELAASGILCSPGFAETAECASVADLPKVGVVVSIYSTVLVLCSTVLILCGVQVYMPYACKLLFQVTVSRHMAYPLSHTLPLISQIG